MTMKKGNVLDLNAIFLKLRDFGGTKFKYSVLKNIDLLKPHITPLVELEQTLKAGLAEFEADRNALIWELGVKTEQGGAYMDTADLEAMDAFSTRLQGLIEKHQESIDAYELRYKEFQEILDEELEADIKFRKVDIDSCPDSGITAEELKKLIDFDIITE